jgi:hypothetical protein
MRSKLASIAQSVLGNVQDGSRDLEIRAWEGLRVSRSTRVVKVCTCTYDMGQPCELHDLEAIARL